MVSNAKTYPGFAELASLAKSYLITLVLGCVCLIFECFACLAMPFLVSNAKTYPGFTELAPLAKFYLITLVVRCLPYFQIFCLSLDAILRFEC